MWVFAASAIIMLVALMTYDSRDPGFSHTGDGQAIRNQIGSAGAWFSDVTFSLFGTPAFLFPALVMLGGWFIFSARDVSGPLDRTVMGTRFAGFLLTLATSCALAMLHFQDLGLPQSAGGALGELIGGACLSVLGPLGSTLILLALWLAGVSLFTGMSWLDAMDSIGGSVLNAIDRLRAVAFAIQERATARRAQEQRQKEVRIQRKKEVKRKAPRIVPVLPTLQIGARVEK